MHQGRQDGRQGAGSWYRNQPVGPRRQEKEDLHHLAVWGWGGGSHRQHQPRWRQAEAQDREDWHIWDYYANTLRWNISARGLTMVVDLLGGWSKSLDVLNDTIRRSNEVWFSVLFTTPLLCVPLILFDTLPDAQPFKKRIR